jgi:hypothetical protein
VAGDEGLLDVAPVAVDEVQVAVTHRAVVHGDVDLVARGLGERGEGEAFEGLLRGGLGEGDDGLRHAGPRM